MKADALSSKLTITLTGRRPVSIEKNEWQILASAKQDDPAHGARKIVVRQNFNRDQAIVYWIVEGPDGRRGGSVLRDVDNDERCLPDRVAERVVAYGEMLEFDDDVINECLSDLPAEEL